MDYYQGYSKDKGYGSIVNAVSPNTGSILTGFHIQGSAWSVMYSYIFAEFTDLALISNAGTVLWDISFPYASTWTTTAQLSKNDGSSTAEQMLYGYPTDGTSYQYAIPTDPGKDYLTMQIIEHDIIT